MQFRVGPWFVEWSRSYDQRHQRRLRRQSFYGLRDRQSHFDRDNLLLLSGTGDVIQPTDGIAAIGSGGPYAQAAARALVLHSKLDTPAVVRTAVPFHHMSPCSLEMPDTK